MLNNRLLSWTPFGLGLAVGIGYLFVDLSLECRTSNVRRLRLGHGLFSAGFQRKPVDMGRRDNRFGLCSLDMAAGRQSRRCCLSADSTATETVRGGPNRFVRRSFSLKLLDPVATL